MPLGEVVICNCGYIAKGDTVSHDYKGSNHPGIGRNDRILGNTSIEGFG